MHVQHFSLRSSNSLGGLNTTALDRFLASREVLRFREHFFEVHKVPHLLCVVTWQLAEHTRARPCGGHPRSSRGAQAPPLRPVA